MAPGDSRRGRPRAGEAHARRQAVLDAAFDELVERGYEATSMLGIARRAAASKETLYAWFGSKQGLFAELIRHNAEQVNRRVTDALRQERPPRDTLTACARNLLELLVGHRAVALNRAAMTSSELAELLLRHGRHTTGPIVEAFLGHLADRGVLTIDDPAEAFQLLFGLVVRDLQIRALLGETPPAQAQLAGQAERAVDRFLALTGSRSG